MKVSFGTKKAILGKLFNINYEKCAETMASLPIYVINTQDNWINDYGSMDKQIDGQLDRQSIHLYKFWNL